MKALSSVSVDGIGVEDGIYVNFFGVDGKAAMLACDMYGVLPQNLLYLPKEMFLQTRDESEQIVLVRYTMCERSRQGTFRTLLGAKSKLIAEGKVEALWEERCRALPDAAPRPRFAEQQLKEAATALDTDSESDSEQQIDERGMLKPPPPPPSSAPPFTFAGPGNEAAAQAAASEEDGLPTAAINTPYGGAQDSNSPPPLRTQASSDAACETRIGSNTAVTTDNAMPPVDAQRMTQQPYGDWSQYELVKPLPLPRRRQLRTQPPTLPKPYFPRVCETLRIEEAELAVAQHELSRYTTKVAKQLQARQQERFSGLHTHGHSTSLPPLTFSLSHSTTGTHLPQSVELRNRREHAAIMRVAQLRVCSLNERYEQARSIGEEMEAIPSLGTLEHMLKYQQSIGVTPELEDRIQAKAEREESRAAARQAMREAEWERVYAMEEKAQHAKEVREVAHEKTKGIAAEAQRVQRLITKWKQAAANRQQETHLNQILHRSAVRHAKADTYIEAKRASASMLRYHHDQQEMHRRQLRNMIRDMMIRKNFAADEVTDWEKDIVA
ncbi:hypothetical protein MNV84_06588 [Leishmania braziliensis]|nr:hypothetical protein MNV84_06588 [Leishmania braziliensis]CAJ2478995.1 unnamed protein product [Leishmania braziliensis]